MIGLGGAIGAICRYLLSRYFAERYGAGFPYGTLFINVSGSFILGLFNGLATRQILGNDEWRWLVAVGFLGGYTTFSTSSYETLSLFRQGDRRGWWNLLGSPLLGVVAAGLGFFLST